MALLALAATLPMMAGRIDLTVGYGIVMWHILAISFQVKYGIPWPIAMPASWWLRGGLVGLINGVLVEVAQVDAFVTTLGTGTILYALALWHTDGRQIIGSLPPDFLAINAASIVRHTHSRILRAWAGVAAVDRQRAPADGPVYLRDRRQREGGGAERHPGAGAM